MKSELTILVSSLFMEIHMGIVVALVVVGIILGFLFSSSFRSEIGWFPFIVAVVIALIFANGF